MSVPKYSSDKSVRDEARILRSLGFEFVRFRNGGRSHPLFRHPTYGDVGMSSTPDDANWIKSHRRRLADAMGLTVRELDERITGQARGKRTASHRRPPSGRARQAPRGLRHLSAAPGTAAAPAVKPAPAAWAVTDPITPDRVACWDRLKGEAIADHLEHPYPWPRRNEAA